MKKRFLLFMVCATLMAIPAHAAKTYVSGSVGLGLPENALWRGSIEDNLNNSVAVNGAVGCNFNPARVELGMSYQSHKYTEYHPLWGDMSFLTVMGNGYYDFKAVSNISPYLMAGVGWVDVHTSNYFMNQTAFAWQAGAGIGIKVAREMTVDLGYRHLKPEGLHSVMNDKLTWAGHNILAGMRYAF